VKNQESRVRRTARGSSGNYREGLTGGQGEEVNRNVKHAREIYARLRRRGPTHGLSESLSNDTGTKECIRQGPGGDSP